MDSNRANVVDGDGAIAIDPAEYGPFPDFKGTDFEIFCKKKQFLEEKLAIKKPDAVKGYILFENVRVIICFRFRSLQSFKFLEWQPLWRGLMQK